MSERTPLNDHAAQAAAAAAAQRRRMSPADLAADTPPAAAPDAPPRRTRKPFGSQEQKLSWPEREGFHRHWFNDEPGRLIRANEAGYEHVHDPATGKNVCTVVGIARGGGPLTAYLMEIPLQWYQEDMAAQDSVVHERLGQIAGGDFERPTGRDGSLRYAGSTRGPISIETGGRR